jgi:hypothetical protein
VIAPPALAGGVWSQFVAHHALLALGYFVAYETAVAIVGFVAVIVREISFRWQGRLTENLDLAIRRRVSRFDDHYREFLLAGLRFVDLKGLATIGPFTPELDEVFVDVSLVFRPPHLISQGVLGDQADTGRRPLSEFIGQRRPTVLAVVGAPGSGKTTLLRHTARHVCLEARTQGRSGRNLPILLYLRDHASVITKDPTVSLAALVRSTLGTLAANEAQGWFEQKLRGGRCLILLDGFDEVARQSDRVKVAEWVERQVHQYSANDFVISSRPHGYQTAPITGAEVVQVCGFTSTQVESFIHGWYLAVERHSTGVNGLDIEARARTGSDDLLQRLDQAPALYDLTVNPLLLTMIANVHRYRGALPGNRADLYSEICQVMLWRRQDAKNLASQMNGGKKETVLRGLAFTMMHERITDLRRDDVISVIKPELGRQSRTVTAEDFLADVVTSGLLTERETEQFSFAHQTFQEYLAAAHIREKGLVSVLADTVGDSWWRETTLLYAARSDADPIITACIIANNVPAIALAFDCVDQDSAFDPSLHAQLDDLLKSAFNAGTEPERRQLMTGVLLTRRLRKQTRVPDGTRLCVNAVTRDIYNLFLEETHIREPDSHTWALTPDETIKGTRGSDAVSFLNWANSVSGGMSRYHLPAVSTLNSRLQQSKISQAPDPGIYVTWADDGTLARSQAPVLWVPPGERHPHEMSHSAVANYVHTDLERSIPSSVFSFLAPRLLTISSMITNLIAANQRIHDVINDPVHLDDPESISNRAADSARARLEKFKYDFGQDCDLMRQFASDIASDFEFALYLALARRLARARDLAVQLRRNTPSSSGHARELAAELAEARDHVRSFSGSLALGRTTFDLFNDADYVMPQILRKSISAALEECGHGKDFLPLFSAWFAKRAGIEASSWHVHPDRISDNLNEAVASFLAGMPAESKDHPISWMSVTARRLKDEAERVFTRSAPASRDASASIRLSALVLAGEIDELELSRAGDHSWRALPARSRVGDMFREVAAAITWLERRHNGQDPATEVIMLAVD